MSLATASDFFFFACIEGVKDKIIKYHLDNCYYENVQSGTYIRPWCNMLLKKFFYYANDHRRNPRVFYPLE